MVTISEAVIYFEWSSTQLQVNARRYIEHPSLAQGDGGIRQQLPRFYWHERSKKRVCVCVCVWRDRERKDIERGKGRRESEADRQIKKERDRYRGI